MGHQGRTYAEDGIWIGTLSGAGDCSRGPGKKYHYWSRPCQRPTAIHCNNFRVREAILPSCEWDEVTKQVQFFIPILFPLIFLRCWSTGDELTQLLCSEIYQSPCFHGGQAFPTAPRQWLSMAGFSGKPTPGKCTTPVMGSPLALQKLLQNLMWSLAPHCVPIFPFSTGARLALRSDDSPGLCWLPSHFLLQNFP